MTKYYEVCAREGHTTHTRLVYGADPAQAMKTAKASGLMGEVSCVNELMLCSVWIPPEVMEQYRRSGLSYWQQLEAGGDHYEAGGGECATDLSLREEEKA